MRVLFVDDDRNVLSSVARTLRRESHEVILAENAASALGILEREDVDVIVSDDRMPGMTGTRLLHEVRERRPDVLRILLTGHGDLETALRAINEGEVFRFLVKPCRPEDLIAALRDASHQRELLLENQRLVELLSRRRSEMKDLSADASELRDVVKDDSGAIVIGGVLDDLATIVEQMEREVAEAEARLRRQEARLGRGRAA